MKAVAAVGALGLIVAACAEDSTSSTDSGTAAPAGSAAATDAPAGTEAPAATDAPAGSDATTDTEATADTTAGTDVEEPEGDFTQEELDQWGIDYTGATPGEASGEPLTIGYVNQEAVFPENTVGIKAAIEYVNTELGGFGGRPGRARPVRHQRRGGRHQVRLRDAQQPRCELRAHRHAARRQPAAVRRARRPEAGHHRQRRHPRRLPHDRRRRLPDRLGRRDPGHGRVRHRAPRSEADECRHHVRRQPCRPGRLRLAAQAGVRRSPAFPSPR